MISIPIETAYNALTMGIVIYDANHGDRMEAKGHETKCIMRTLKEYQIKNGEKYGILKLGLFGSVARETHREHSDIDIVITLREQDFSI